MGFPLALGRYALAARRSHPDKLRKTRALAEHLLVRTASAATSSGLQPWLPTRLDQGASGACTAHSFAGAIATRAVYVKQPPNFVPSPRELYATTRAWERAAAAPIGELQPLTDSGAELADVVASVAVFGVSPIQTPTPDGRNSDVWTEQDTTAVPANVNFEPDGQQLEGASADPLSGAYTLDLAAPTTVQTAVAALSTGLPLYTGFFVDSAFQNLGPNDIAQPPNQSDPNGGGHAVFLADFRISTSVPGTTEFLLVNSWGGSWASNGTVWCSQAWLLAAWEAWAADESIVAARGAA